MRKIFWLLCVLVMPGCVVVANAKNPYPNIVVPQGPPGHLTSVELEHVGEPLCSTGGTGKYCIKGFDRAIKDGVTKLFGEYFKGEGPGYKARFTVQELSVGEKSKGCGKQVCSSTLPVLEWRFELEQEGGAKPVRIALTTYGHRGYNQGTFQMKGVEESAESLIEQVLAAINARLSAAR
jgi:hypothetical protein